MSDTVSEQGASASSESGESVSLAEFSRLKTSYENLRADYTRKCQKLKDLERAGTNEGERVLPSPAEEERFFTEKILNDPKYSERVLLNYLSTRCGPAPRLSTGKGSPVTSAPPQPKTLQEAGEQLKLSMRK